MPSTHWAYTDFTSANKVNVVSPTAFTAYFYDTNTIAYYTKDGHITELIPAAGGPIQTDLTALTGAPPGNLSTALASYTENITYPAKQVDYLTSDGHIHELWVGVANPSWNHSDLTQITGSPPSSGTSISCYAWQIQKQVVYLTNDGHIHELSVAAGSSWIHTDLSQITGAPPSPGRSLCGYGWQSGSTKQVVYVTNDGHIHELFVPSGQSWAHADLT